MSLFSIFSTAGSALNAQTVRLNVTASNLANVDSVASNENEAYRAKVPVFAAMVDEFNQRSPASGVLVKEISESTAPVLRQYRPHHPLSDEEGYVMTPNVNPMDEMANMISASRSYQNNVEVMNTTKEMLLRTLTLGR